MRDPRGMLHSRGGRRGRSIGRVEPRTDALVRISALVALGAPEALCRTAIARAVEAGASDKDVVATLIDVATIIGHARLTAAAPVIALGLGYEVDSALCA